MAKIINQPPFIRADALDDSRLEDSRDQVLNADFPASPHTPQCQLGSIEYIPGEPAVPLAELEDFLQREVATLILDELYNVLHIFARKLGSNIDALHAQNFKGRRIVPVENPRFHLIRQEKNFFIKPIPVCLLNYDFWTQYLASDLHTSRSDSYRAMALGFLRSYSHLILHQSDLRIAKEHGLIPEDITWAGWSKFIRGFRLLNNEDVARRYHYGQIRLTRLNWAIFIFRPKSAGSRLRFYHESPRSALAFIQHAAVPLAFIFASVSLILSSMQVMLTVPDDSLLFGGIALSSALLVFIPVIIFIYQISWGILKYRGK
ncbi:hypothetical protein CI102_9816 [Trichoderma harzianum]|uniref:Uncharacterized protein n=1 Tax=Trichoderma harzianum CBS 226.95 TaxID=983964 RepID=A0A2T4AA42_TRIHA|nr:hypothetical protein M431DRAFT_87000 [Trichoderma harzianum CBS 226.95]PKK45424.1 hypothetical protein CI102_9816 [Trichoderma harzianum]PTB53788.1 hypothetical protein M431DRAFT_87000 [Trichoderma harzianum CBS 226.95]